MYELILIVNKTLCKNYGNIEKQKNQIDLCKI